MEEKKQWPEYAEIEARLQQYSPSGSGRMTAAELVYIFSKSKIEASEDLYDIAALAYKIGYSKAKKGETAMSKNFGFAEAEVYRGMYEKYKDDPEVDAEDLERKARIFEHIGHALDADPNAAQYVMDSGLFNEYMEAYLKIATARAGLDQDTQRAVMDSLHVALDNYTASEAMEEASRIK